MAIIKVSTFPSNITAAYGDAIIFSSPDVTAKINGFPIEVHTNDTESGFYAPKDTCTVATSKGIIHLKVSGQNLVPDEVIDYLSLDHRAPIDRVVWRDRSGSGGGGGGNGYTKQEVDNKLKLKADKSVTDGLTTKVDDVSKKADDVAKKTENVPGKISMPISFPWKTPPVMIKRDPFGKYSAVVNAEKFIPLTGKTYYVDVATGDDAKDGLTPATSLKNLRTALLKADARIIYVAPGMYHRDRGWADANPASNNLIVKALQPGTVTLDVCEANLVWTLESGNVYKATRTGTVNVRDTIVLDDYGDYADMIKATSIADAEAKEGSWFTDGTTVYVHLKGNRVPDSRTNVYVTGRSGSVIGDKTLFVEGINFYGGDIPFEAGLNSTVYFKDCQFKYGYHGNNSANGLNVKGAKEVIVENCVAARNQRDGFNYHEYTGVNPNAIEIDCTSYNNGLLDSNNNNNGTTVHELVNIIRINGMHFNNKGPNVADVGGSCSLNLGIVAYESKSSTGSSSVNFQNQDGKSWLDGCIGYGSTTDISEVGTGKIYSKRSTMSGKFYETGSY